MGNNLSKPPANPAVKLMLGLLLIYRWSLSPALGALGVRCRFYPSCSQYAVDAFNLYGFWLGFYKTVRRLLKCHPLHPGGYDPA